MPVTMRARAATQRRNRFLRRLQALRLLLLAAAALLGTAGIRLHAAPDDTRLRYSVGDFTAGGRLEAGFGYFGMRNIDFGRGNFNGTDDNRRRHRSWFEGYLKPTVTAQYALA